MNSKPSIQLHIPTPCHEDWQKMTPCEQGRFCSSCQKTVIDFTSWSDKALYEFFSKKTTNVCGSFLGRQLGREIHIPPQPASRLYRIAIACGLTLIFTQIPNVHANVKAPIEYAEVLPDEKDSQASIEGNVIDEKYESVIGAKVSVFKNGIKQTSTTTDVDGHYVLKPLLPGLYDLAVEYANYKKVTITQISVGVASRENVDVHLNQSYLEEVSITYVKPLIAIKSQKTFSADDLRYQGGPVATPSITSTIAAMKNAERRGTINSIGNRAENTLTVLDGVMIREDAPTQKKKKGFFNFLKRKKKSNEQ